MNAYFVLVMTSVVIGLVCAGVAYKKGKDPFVWFFAGALLNVFVVIFILLIKEFKQRKERLR